MLWSLSERTGSTVLSFRAQESMMKSCSRREEQTRRARAIGASAKAFCRSVFSDVGDVGDVRWGRKSRMCLTWR